MPPRKNPESAEIRKRNPAKGTESKIVKAQAELSEQQQLLEKEFETTVKLPYIINFIYQYLVWIYSSILYLSKINVNMATVDRGKAFNNKILILGDDFAAGVGDKQEFYKVQGITGHLQIELARLHEIKQTWRIYNLGVSGSTSQDWLLKPGSLLDKVLKNKEYNDSKIVILMLGLVDCKKCNYNVKTISHIEEIAGALKERGIHVYLSMVPNCKFYEIEQEYDYGKSLDVNDAIVKMVEQDPKYEFLIRNYYLGPDCSVLNYEFKGTFLYGPDLVHFGPKGYQKLGRDYASLITNHLIRFEFQQFRKALGM